MEGRAPARPGWAGAQPSSACLATPPPFCFCAFCGQSSATQPPMTRTLVKDALNATAPMDAILLQGWVRTRRDAKAFSFIELNDGSCLKGIQIVADASLPDYANITKANTGAALEVRGKLVESKGSGQK